MKNKRILFLINFILCFMLFTGCESQKTDAYIRSMNEHLAAISEISVSMNKLQPEVPASKDDLLSYVDEVSRIFSEMTQLTVPSGYETIGNLTNSASSTMIAASSLYHQAYAGDSFDPQLSEDAKTKYLTSMEYLNIIGELLRGDSPSSNDVYPIYE